MIRFQLRALFTICLVFSAFISGLAEEVKPVKYVFLFIGDGLSIPQRIMAEEFMQKTEKRGLYMNSMKHQALTSTRAANSFITDSAASGTAIACGEKTNNGHIGVAADGKRRLESVAEVAKKNGRKVGIITTVTLNHATPASFYAHNSSRGNAYDIGLDLIASEFDYFGGGGLDKPNDDKSKNYKGDFYKLAAESGYTVSRNKDDFKKIKPGIGKVVSVGASGALPYTIDTPKDELRLSDFTRQGIEMLQDSPNGFFMMVEGGAIDWMCHANDATTTLYEIIDFDNAIAVAFEFAEKHPEETLIVVTGDHETGGLTLGFIGTGYSSYIELLKNQKASSGELGSMIRKLGREKGEKITFDDLKHLVTEKSGLIFAKDGKREKGGMNLSESEEKELENLYKKSLENGKLAHGSEIARNIVRMVNNKAGLGWTSNAHTALPVNTTASGPEAKHFSNMIDNTDIAKILKQTVK